MTPEHELVIERIFDAPVDKVFKAWTTPDILMRWWCPPPWRVTACEIDLRPGGRFNTVMQGPDGEVMDNKGSVLEVIPGRRFVFTDAFAADWVPVGKPFMVGYIAFEDLGDGRTRYTGKARHWSAEDKASHEQMGFSEGWGIAADQLAALLPTL
jgi:uncharacterized protein YndB with AHSA1/START domain